MQIYLHQNEQQVGPFSIQDIQSMLASGSIAVSDYGWHEGLTEWQPLNSFLPQLSPPVPQTVSPVVAKPIQTNVRQGAVIGGWVCFALGVILMIVTMWSFIIYAPLFFVAFVLSIVAMAQRRIFGGILLLLATVIVPVLLGLVLFTSRTKELAENLKKEVEAAKVSPNELGGVPEPVKAIVEASRETKASIQPTPSNLALDEKNGFRNFRLGTPYSEFSTMTLSETKSDKADEKRYFVREKGEHIGGAEISYILLIFSQDILKQVQVGVSGDQNRLGLREALITAFGEPKSEKGFSGERLVWEGAETELTLQPFLNDASAAIYRNKAVEAQIAEIIRQKAKDGAAVGAKSL